jgi:RHS repeat-associated protein
LINNELMFDFNNQSNRLLSTTADTFSYDQNGQQARKGEVNYHFDAMQRLIGIGENRSFEYDGSGNRIGAIRNGVNTQYVYDAAGNLIAQANQAGQIARYYIYGNGLAAMVTAGGAVYVYHFDGTGHTIALTDGARVPVNRYAYSPYGEVLGQQEEVPQPFKYAGQVGIYAEADNLYYMRARYYDAQTGRFISEDPAGFIDGSNLFAYVGGNPVNRVDPLGLWSASVEAYAGVGGGLSIAYNNGTLEVLSRVGVGIGVGASMDPDGTPSPHAESSGSGYIARTRTSASLAVGVGPLNYGATLAATTGNAVTTPEGGGFITREAGPSLGQVTAPGFRLGFSSGVEIGSFTNGLFGSGK